MAAEVVRIMCPSLKCRKILAVPITSRGKTVRCGNCGGTIRVPQTAAAAASPDAPEQSGNAEGAPLKRGR